MWYVIIENMLKTNKNFPYIVLSLFPICKDAIANKCLSWKAQCPQASVYSYAKKNIIASLVEVIK